MSVAHLFASPPAEPGNVATEPLAHLYAPVTERGVEWIARAVDGGGGTRFVASTGNVDRMGDVIDQASWVLDPYTANPVIMSDHGLPVVGRGVAELGTVSGKVALMLSVTWHDDAALNPIGALLAAQHEQGFRSAVSVGFLPGQTINRADLPADHPLYVNGEAVPRWRAGYLFLKPELLEVSSVAVPANREALQLSMELRERSDGGDPVTALRSYLRQVATRSTEDEILAACRSSARVRAAISSIAMGAPPERPAKAGPLDHLWSLG